MKRLLLSALVAFAPVLPAAAQVAGPIVARAVVSAPSAVASISAAALVPTLSASSAAPLPLGQLSAPPLLSAPLPALPVPAPGLVANEPAPPAEAPPAAQNAARPPAGKNGPVVLHSLQDLDHLFQAPDGKPAGSIAYDGAGEHGNGTLSGAAAVKAEIRSDFVAKRAEGIATRASFPELAPHEVKTIRKIQVLAKDLSVLVREAGPTPDLIVNGIVTEMKSIPKGTIVAHLKDANVQLRSFAERHGLGLGAVVLDAWGGAELPPAEVEAGIAQVVKEASPVGFARVYVFNGDDLKTYARAADGVFRLDPAAVPFSPLGSQPPVSSALADAVLPDIGVVVREIQEPSRLLKARGVEAIVTMYGSARIQSPEDAAAVLEKIAAQAGQDAASRKRLAAAHKALEMSKYYGIARELGALVAKQGRGKVAVVTGGGPGIMEAGNRGAFEAGGPSVGYNIKLPNEQGLNRYATPGLDFAFEHFATRKMALRHGAMGLVYFPGGYGTMDELFEVLTLIQTGKMKKVPIVLIGEKSYWEKILDFDEFSRMGLISEGDLSLFTFAESAPQAWDAIRAGHAAVAANP